MHVVQMMTRVRQTFDPATIHNFHAVKVSRFSRNWTLLVFALELSIGSGSPDAFDALNMYWNSGETLGGLPTAPYGYLADALLLTPNGECMLLLPVGTCIYGFHGTLQFYNSLECHVRPSTFIGR